MKNTLRWILKGIKEKKIDSDIGYQMIRNMEKNYPKSDEDKIAVIGVGLCMPKCADGEEFWNVLKDGICTVDQLSDNRKHDIWQYMEGVGSTHVDFRRGSFMERIDLFDHDFFKIPPKEAALMNPVQRIFLETVIVCLFDAGYDKKLRAQGEVGTYIGYGEYLYENYGMMIHNHANELLYADKVGNIASMMLRRLYKFLDISGPSMLIDTACSSSATALIEACDALRDGKIDLAFAGGIRINNLPIQFEETKIGVESSDDYTRTFDDYADGAGVGEGAGLVMLKRLQDAVRDNDRIYAVISGYAVSTESRGISLTAPTVQGQKEVILKAWDRAGISAEDIGYIELHGTGTRLGDSIEFAALNEAFQENTSKHSFCAVGASKSNFGHLHEAAGILGLLKCIYMLNYKIIPKSLHFTMPNRTMDMVDSALYMSTKTEKWSTQNKRVLGLNSFGLSGTNCHVVLEEYTGTGSAEVWQENPVVFKKVRCWYTDYIEDSQIAGYVYKWEICGSNDLIGSAGQIDHKYQFIYLECNKCNDQIIQQIRLHAEVHATSIWEYEHTEENNTDVIFSLLQSKDLEKKRVGTEPEIFYDTDTLEQLVRICKWILASGSGKREIRVISSRIFSVDGSVNDNYRQSIYLGYLSVFAKELNNSTFVSVDTDLEDLDRTVQAILYGKERYLSVLGHEIYERVFCQEKQTGKTSESLKNMVWVVIGGTSGIGLECVDFFINRMGIAHVAVIGRRNWEDVRQKFCMLKQVLYYQADICDELRLSGIFQEIQADYGKIAGVVNAAGLARDVLLAQRTEKNLIFYDILRVKIIGNENLVKAAQKSGVREIITFSSIATIFSMIGQSDYVAANLYCETMAQYYRSMGFNVRTILWNTWGETGMAFRSGLCIDTIFHCYTSEQGQRLFGSFLCSNCAEQTWGILNGSVGKSLLRSSRVKISQELKNKWGISNDRNDSKKQKVLERADVAFDKQEELTTEKQVYTIINQFLGYDTFDYEESLFELGVDSISLIKIQKELADHFQADISIADIVENSSVSLLTQLLEQKSVNQAACSVLTDVDSEEQGLTIGSDDIAVIGCSAILPGCRDADEFADILCRKGQFDTVVRGVRRDDIEDFLETKHISKTDVQIVPGSMLERIDLFDAEFFGIAPKEAEYMAPEQRLSLESAYHALEDAGYASRIKKTNTAVFTAYSQNPRDSYGAMILECCPEEMPYAEFGNTTSVIAGRISHYFDLSGVAMNIDTACSSSLTAVSIAMNGLKKREYDYAVVQGIKVGILPVELKNASSIGTLSPDHRTRTFDEHAQGYGTGEGILTLILKRKEEAVRDQDHIYALLCGSAINHNGKTKNIAAPDRTKQVELLRKVLQNSHVGPEDIEFVETHGTATAVGDNIEFEALKEIFAGRKRGTCPIGMLKSSIGHLSEASGMLSIYKVISMFQNEIIFPNVELGIPQHNLNMIDSAFYINSKRRMWKTKQKTTLINCLGINGTNAQVVLQAPNKAQIEADSEQQYLFLLSARNRRDLAVYCREFYQYCSEHNVNLQDLSYTLCIGKEKFAYRIAFLYKCQDDLCGILNQIVCYGFDESRGDYFINFNEKNEIIFCQAHVALGHTLQKACLDFVNAESIEYSTFFTEKNTIISLPLYPFARKRHWIPVKKSHYFYMDWSPWGKLSQIGQTDLVNETEVIIFHAGLGRPDWLLEDVFFDSFSYQLFEVNVQEEKSILATLKEQKLNEEDKPVSFLFVVPHMPEPDSLAELKEEQQRGVEALAKTVRILCELRKGNKTELAIVTEHAVSVCKGENYYANSTVIGMGMCISHEYPNIQCKICDIDTLQTLAVHASKIISQRVNSLIAIRNDLVYLKTMYKKDCLVNRKAYKLDKNSAYMISGASGGIGRSIVEYLIQNGIRKLICLCSEREKICGKEPVFSYDGISVDKVSIKQYYLDVGNEASLQYVFQDVKKSGWQLKGIFHCAGRVDAGLMIHMGPENYENVFSAKVYGSWLINKMAKGIPLDFIIYFSSEISTNGEAGMGLYTAGNYFMNELAGSQKADSCIRKSFLFTTWQEVGMGKRNHTNVDLIFKTMKTKRAIAQMFQYLAEDERGIIIGELNEAMMPELANKLERVAFRLGEELEYEFLKKHPDLKKYLDIKTYSERKSYNLIGDIPEKSRERLVKGKHITNVKLSGIREIDSLQEEVGRCYAKVLGYDEIDIDSSFFELGGDSILITRLQLMLNERYPGAIALTDLYAYGTIRSLAGYLREVLTAGQKQVNQNQLQQAGILLQKERSEPPIAIIGCSFQFPECSTQEELYDMLNHGFCTVQNAPEKRRKIYEETAKLYEHKMAAIPQPLEYKDMSYLTGIADFDYSFFGLKKEEANILEPVLRLLMENIYHAVEDAGYSYTDFKNMDKLFYLGYSAFSDYTEVMKKSRYKTAGLMQNQASYICGRLAQQYHFNEEAVVVDTACSSALAAIHMAANRIKNTGRLAIVSCVCTDILIIREEGRAVGYESKDGITRTLDEYASGSGEAEGVATIILKDYGCACKDRDFVQGIIRSCVVNSSGYSAGITVPDQRMEEEVVEQAWRVANIDPEELNYIELHGTGTPVGDVIEIQALKNVFERFTNKKNFCGIGSIKANMGHLFECAGLAGLMKVLCMIKYHKIFTMPNFGYPNKKLDLIDSAMYIGRKRLAEAKPMLCGISSFGISGVNCHMVVAEGDSLEDKEENQRYPHILKVSAKSRHSLYRILQSYMDIIQNQGTMLPRLTFTMNTCREDYAYRVLIQFQDKDELIRKMHDMLRTEERETSKQKAFKTRNNTCLGTYENMEQMIDEYKKGMYTSRNIELILQEQYMKGETIPWKQLYTDEFRKIPIPGYQFDQEICWLGVDNR